MGDAMWRVRPSGDHHEGKAVPFDELSRAIAGDRVGELDEVRAPGDEEWLAVRDHDVAAEFLPPPRRLLERGADDAEADMTPMIDVTFQLVIFFMIAATYTIQKTLDLPKLNQDEASAVTMEDLEQENIIVRIASDGSIQVDDAPVAVDELVGSLREATRSRRSSELVLDVEDDAAHDIVVKVIDAAGAVNIEKVLFVSRVES